MRQKTCPYCKRRFKPSRYHPNQKVCGSGECQRRRRADYHRWKLDTDPAYKEQCRRSQRKWRKANPDYMRRYLARRAIPNRSVRSTGSLVKELERLLDLARDNSLIDLRSSNATILLVCPKEAAGEKNSLAYTKNIVADAKLIVFEGSLKYVLSSQE